MVRIGLDAEVAAFLTDRNALIPAIARDAARRTGVDSSRVYRHAVSAEHPDVGAIDGLSEIGAPADVTLLVNLLDSPVPQIRAHALRGLRVLNTVPVQRVLPLLLDSSTAVVREAATALCPAVSTVPKEFLWEMLANTEKMVVRQATYRLLARLDRVTRLRAALILVADPEPRLARIGIAATVGQIGEARNHLTVEPLEVTSGQLAELSVLGRVAAARLGAHTEKQLQSWLNKTTPQHN